MTVADKLDDSKTQSTRPYYIHLQNLPAQATQDHIRLFFSGLRIPSGGISLHFSGAVVALYHREDALAAVQMAARRKLMGKALRVSNLTYKDMRRAKKESVKRKLVFEPAMPETVIPETNLERLLYKPNKRIRPTAISRKIGDNLAKKFCPDEVDTPVGAEDPLLDKKETSTMLKKSRKQQLKTIKPTPVISLKQFNLVYNNEVF